MSEQSFVLVVEDNNDLREALCVSLEVEGVLATGASDGWEALELLRCGLRPSVIVVDLLMPQMDGIEFRTKQLAEDPEIARIPVVVLTGDSHRVSDAMKLGVAGVVKKPTAIEGLLQALSAFLGREP
jgi:two-component system, chemotaxis family, chemotaxis protein CheY